VLIMISTLQAELAERTGVPPRWPYRGELLRIVAPVLIKVFAVGEYFGAYLRPPLATWILGFLGT